MSHLRQLRPESQSDKSGNVPKNLKQHPIGLEEVADGIWSIYFCRVLLGRIDERDYIIRA
jgi:hypothetical protein